MEAIVLCKSTSAKEIENVIQALLKEYLCDNKRKVHASCYCTTVKQLSRHVMCHSGLFMQCDK